jgi:hypothetical protein
MATWKEHSFASLRPNMILSSMGGHRWLILDIRDAALFLRDMESGKDSHFIVPPHRMYWTYVAEV